MCDSCDLSSFCDYSLFFLLRERGETLWTPCGARMSIIKSDFELDRVNHLFSTPPPPKESFRHRLLSLRVKLINHARLIITIFNSAETSKVITTFVVSVVSTQLLNNVNLLILT